MDKKQFENLNIDKSKLVLATGKVSTHDAKLETKPVGFLKDAMRRFTKNKASVVGAIIICFLILFAIVGPMIATYDFNYQNSEKKYYKPYIPGLEWLGIDGCETTTLSEKIYYKYLAMEQESGNGPIEERLEVNYVDYGIAVGRTYTCKVNTYRSKGVIPKNLTLEQYKALQEYQKDTGIQVLYPVIDTENNPYNKGDANLWYKVNAQGIPVFADPQNPEFQNVYMAYASEDPYDSIRIEGEEQPLYRYSKPGAGTAVSYDVRVNEYRYDQYLNATKDSDGNWEPGREPAFWFGSDSRGRDIFVRLATGARFSFLLALFVSLINMTVGAIYGAIEGYYGGTIDIVMERITEIVSSIPMYVVISLIKWHWGRKLGENGMLISLVLAFFVTGWIGMAGGVRRQFYRFKNQEFVYAARTLGASDFRLMFKHIFPNSLGTLVTSSVLVIPGVIFSESSLSYLGIVSLDDDKIASVGTMLSNSRADMSSNPHVLFWPALFIALLMISFNLFGNGLRDAFNPSLRGSEG